MKLIDEKQGVAVFFAGHQSHKAFMGLGRRRPGQSLMEYGLLISLVVVVSVGGLLQLGLSVGQQTRDGVNLFASTGGGGPISAGLGEGGPGAGLPGGVGGNDPVTASSGGTGGNTQGPSGNEFPGATETLGTTPFLGGVGAINGSQGSNEGFAPMPVAGTSGSTGINGPLPMPVIKTNIGQTPEVAGGVGNPTLGSSGGGGASLPNQPMQGIPGSPDDWIKQNTNFGGGTPMPAGGGDWTPNDHNNSSGYSPSAGTGNGGQSETAGVPGRSLPGGSVPSYNPNAGTGSGGQPEVAGFPGIRMGEVAQPVNGGGAGYDVSLGAGGSTMSAPNMASPFDGGGGYYEPVSQQHSGGGAMPSYGGGW